MIINGPTNGQFSKEVKIAKKYIKNAQHPLSPGKCRLKFIETAYHFSENDCHRQTTEGWG